MQELDGFRHRGKGGGHQGAQARELGARGFHRLDHRFRRHIPPEVDHAVTVVFQHGPHDILPDVVNVAAHRREHDAAAVGLFGFALGEGFADDVERGLRRLRRADELGQEDQARFIFFPDAVENRDQGFVDDRFRVGAGEKLFGQRRRLALEAALNRGQDVVSAAFLPVRCRAFGSGEGRFRRRSGRGGTGVALDERRTGRVAAREQPVGVERLHHSGVAGIEDREGEAALERHREEGPVDDVAAREAERDVRHAEDGPQPQLFGDPPDRVEGDPGVFLARAGRQRQTVDGDVPGGDAVMRGAADDFFGNPQPPFHRFWNAVLVKGEAHDDGPVFLRDREKLVEDCILSVDRVHQRPPVCGAQARFDRAGVWGINLKRELDDRLNRPDRPGHHGGFVDARHPDVDIENFGAVRALRGGLPHEIAHVAVGEGLFEQLFPGGVEPFPDDAGPVKDESAGRRGDGAGRPPSRDGRRRKRPAGPREGADEDGIGSAAAADDRRARPDQLRHAGGEFLG